MGAVVNSKAVASEDLSGAPALATTVEAAAYLRLSKSMINKLVASGEIPSRRFGRAVRIPWKWLRDKP